MSSAEHSKAVVLLLLIHCLLLPPLFLCFFVCFFLLFFFLGGGVIFCLRWQSSRWERKIASCFTLIAFKCHLTVSVLCFFITVLWVGLQFVILAFPSHTHFSCDLLISILKIPTVNTISRALL